MDKVLIAPATLAGIEAEFLHVLKNAGFEPANEPFAPPDPGIREGPVRARSGRA